MLSGIPNKEEPNIRRDYNNATRGVASAQSRSAKPTYNPIIIVNEVIVRLRMAVFLLCITGLAFGGESTHARIAALQIDPQYGRHRNQQSPDEIRMERERLKGLNKDRQKKLKEDTDKLLQLATELKEYVDKTNENILSIEVIKKTEEIEKLAKSVREKMKTYYEEPGTVH